MAEPIGAFLDELADRAPTPGGGAVAALAGALSAAMARMVAAYSPGKNTSPDVKAEVSVVMALLRATDMSLRRLVDEDAKVYRQWSEAKKSDDEARGVVLLRMIETPLAMAELCMRTLGHMDRLKESANPWLISDLGVAAVLAEAAGRAAGYSVRVNLAELRDKEESDAFEIRLQSLLDSSGQLLFSIEEFCKKRLQ
jgi:formiminotetrahydrofolate cyclodeaminase